ncbi:hypothetical protein TWF788_002670 [Orbilia oligospora]|uniref:DUF4215 domain-containing protein n=1 Tax=Orbilia oligospora TaxID=2813651 RepID=A0A6G1MGE5_ORBOL|nr:hypothetical protein TWF788_002670 [Orbilia oligospora]KAF3201111.1 hypothetical protein TWF679_000462 [Orbilia oligospora]KAF3216964.1 hypothetical protein TWF191_008868 [Orbilia oligospora]KAF3257574.1 hypothetical protein TWF192_000867 [Orbilia oligospora]
MKALSLLPFFAVAFAEDLLFHVSFTGYEDIVASDRNGRYSYNWTYTTVSTREWQAMTTDDFKKYKAIVIGDPISTDPDRLEPLMENRQTWGNAIEGNVILIGTDTSNHYYDAQTLMSNGIAFAATGKGTGLYFSLSKYYGAKNKTTVPILDIFGNFEVRGDLNAEEEENCYDEVHIVARNQVLDGITDQVLSNWSCSVHEAFVTFPSSGTESFVPLAIAQDVPGEGSRDFSDGTSGIPYILVRGASPIGCGNGKLDPGEECDDGNTNDGDGCNSACRFEAGFKKQASGGKIAGGVIGAIASIAALGGLGFLAVTKTVWGAKAGAAIGIGTSSAAGGGGAGGGAGAAGASGAMYVPTGVEGKAAAAVSGYVPTGIEGKAAAQAGYVPGVAEKAANAVAHGTGQAAQGAAQAGQGLSSMAVPPPTDAGATAASTAFAPPVDPTSAAGAATTMAPGIPPGYVPGSEGLAASTAGTATGGAGGTAVGSSAAGGLAPGVASAAGPTGGLAPGIASVASPTGGLAPGLAGGAATGTTVGTGGGLTTAQTVGTSIAAGFAGFGAVLFGRKKKNKENAPYPPDTESMPVPPMAPPVGQQQYYNYTSQQQQPYYPQQQEPIIYAPQPVPEPLGAFNEKEIKSGEPSNNGNLNIGVQEVVPTPSHEIQADPISRPAEMPISEQPYIPPPPPTAAQRKEYDYN